MHELPFRFPTYQMDELLKYLVLNHFAQRESVETADHPSFDMQASFASFTLRKPRPPSDFGK